MGVFLLVWLGCAIAAALIASSKNRSAGGWFFVSLFLGIFGVAIVACLDRLPAGASDFGASSPAASGLEEFSEIGKVPPAAAPSRACPHCAETIKAAAKICRFCQRDVEPVADLPIVKATAAQVPSLPPSAAVSDDSTTALMTTIAAVILVLFGAAYYVARETVSPQSANAVRLNSH